MQYETTRKKLKWFLFDSNLNSRVNSTSDFRRGGNDFHTDFLLEKNPTNCGDANELLVEKSIELLRKKITKAVKLKVDDDKLKFTFSTKNWIKKNSDDEIFLLDCVSHVNMIYEKKLMDSFKLEFKFCKEDDEIFCCNEFCYLDWRKYSFIFVNDRDYYREIGTSRLTKAHNIIANPLTLYLREKRNQRIKINREKKDVATRLRLVNANEKIH